MNYMDMFKSLSDSGILFVGSAAILGFSILAFGALIWLWLQAGKWLTKYVAKASGEFKEAFTKVNGGKVLRMKESDQPDKKGLKA
jgi:hypothetical protein